MISVISGPMFASKSKRLIQYLTGGLTRGTPVLALTPEKDTRVASPSIYSYDGSAFPATSLPSDMPWSEAETFIEDEIPFDTPRGGPHLLALDEAQFVPRGTIDGLVQKYLKSPHWLILCGLLHDSEGEAFGHLAEVLGEYPSRVHQERLTARCSFCHGVALMTHCKVKKTGQVLIGRDAFEPRCLPCWEFGKI